ncbi:MAG: delta-60 repeat domain-containing protein [Proteobacteria bacterium]|nr:delta-60 repeat domain-containing protein [Pseudomonadota bacterium]
MSYKRSVDRIGFALGLSLLTAIASAQSLDLKFARVSPNLQVNAVAQQTDGKLLVGGSFSMIGGVLHPCLVRLNTDGTLDTTFDAQAFGGCSVNAVLIDTAGNILVGGSFSKMGGGSRTNIARLHADGTADTGFNSYADQPVWTFAVQGDGKVLVGGDFSYVGAAAHDRLARLDPLTGLADSAFSPSVSGSVRAVLPQADGHIVFGGQFGIVVGVTRFRLARVDGNGNVDANFHPDPDSGVNALSSLPGGKLLVGGGFSHIGGAAHAGLALLDDTTGAVDATYTPYVGGGVNVLLPMANGDVLVGGSFNGVNTPANGYLARLHADGTVDTDFHDFSRFGMIDCCVNALALDGGFLVVGGSFLKAGSFRRDFLVRLNLDGIFADDFE